MKPKPTSAIPMLVWCAFLLCSSVQALEARNLLVNPSLDDGIDGWMLDDDDRRLDRGTIGWSPADTDGSSSSGSLVVTNTQESNIPYVVAIQCLPVLPGTTYRLAVEFLIPEGQEPAVQLSANTLFYSNADCTGFLEGARIPGVHDEEGAWTERSAEDIVAPDGARSVRVGLGVRKKQELPQDVMAHFDNLFFGPVDGEGGDGVPEPNPSGWFTDPDFPDFRFNVEITAGGGSRLGTPEPFCIPETVCVSGAVPDRVEIQIRIIGPRPNGYLWPTLFKASPSRFDVWIEQLSTGTVKHYVLEGATPGSSELPGLFDREGFLP